MREEISSLYADRGCWEYVPYPSPGTPLLNAHFVFKTKLRHGMVVRRKARLVVGGHMQSQGIDYEETFAPVVKYLTLRTFFAIAVTNTMRVHQLDFERAFAYAPIQVVLYLRPHPEMQAPRGMVCRLLRSLYELKQAPRNWNEHLHEFLTAIAFTRSKHDPCLYMQMRNGHVVLLAVFVDDVLIAYDAATVISRVKADFKAQFTVTDMGEATEFLGVRSTQAQETITLDQRTYCGSHSV